MFTTCVFNSKKPLLLFFVVVKSGYILMYLLWLKSNKLLEQGYLTGGSWATSGLLVTQSRPDNLLIYLLTVASGAI